jgi:N-acetylmuramoyl-L-alanine amidase
MHDIDPVLARRSLELIQREVETHATQVVGCHFPGLQAARGVGGESPGEMTRPHGVRRCVGATALMVPLLIGSAACSSAERAESARARPAVPDTTTSTTSRTDPAAPVPSSTPVGRLAGHRICLDPGHEPYWNVGTSARDRSGGVPTHPSEGISLLEYEVNLAVAYRLVPLLEAEGALVCVTRNSGGALQIEPYDYTGDGLVRPAGVAEEDVGERVQPRIDWANQFGAEILLSIHFNGSEDPSVSGTEVYYSDTSPRAEESLRLATGVMNALLAEFASVGYPAHSRGVGNDRYGRRPPEIRSLLVRHYDAIIRSHGVDPDNCPACDGLLPLGNNPFSLHLGTYVAALVEVEYMTNADVVEQLLLRPDVVDVVARGLADGILAFYGAT